MANKPPFIQKGDAVDALIQARNLDNHPEHFVPLVEELGLTKFMNSLQEHDLKFVWLIGVNRFLNFIEAAHCGDFTPEERKIGAAAVILISCINLNQAKNTRQYNPTYSSVIPVFLYKNTDLDSILEKEFSEEDRVLVKTIVKCFFVVHPTATTMKRSRIAMFIRDACLQFINADNTEIFRFVEAHGSTRREAFDIPFSFDTDMMTGGGVDWSALSKSIRSTYTSSAVTQWGTAKNFNRNSTQRLKVLLEQ